MNEQKTDERAGIYRFAAIEPKWQQYWEENKTFRTPNPVDADFDPSRPKYYVLDMFPYPSGAGLHVGHPEGYTATDILARYKRMRGFNVLHPMGYDAFGLPAEQYAVEHGVHPSLTTLKNITNIRRQIKMIGFSYDWDREFATTDPAYYKWTQWIFLNMFESWFDRTIEWTDAQGKRHAGRARPIAELPIPEEIKTQGEAVVRAYVDSNRLAYIDHVPVNWCPALGTVLANEEVTNEGRSDRGNHPVFRRPLRQWMLRITKYAERLLRDLDELDWPESIKQMQRNWIGRSEGADVDFRLANPEAAGIPRSEPGTWLEQPPEDVIRVYTTRPDTLFGATYMVLAPEHSLVAKVATPEQRDAVEAYVQAAEQKSEMDRTAEAKEKTGVFTGAHAINPVNGRTIPIWVADYVLINYGTGAIMAVPAHDTRDFEFAEKFDLPIVQVVQPTDNSDWRRFIGDGVSVNSPPEGSATIPGGCSISGLPTDEAKKKITAWLADRRVGRFAVNYKLRDWLFSRQRYWGEPFPILHGEDGEVIGLDASELPVALPPMEDFTPHAREENSSDDPEPPLGRLADWQIVERDGKKYRRELNTMPQWAGSCWYFLRYLDPKNDKALCSAAADRYWMPVDLYVGGAEHAVLHLLYARFWHKFLFDLGSIHCPEPFQKLFNQGMIRSFAYRDSRGVPMKYDQVDLRDDGASHKETGETLVESIEKMSKSLNNVVSPDDVIAEYGADTFRLYEMYMGPLEASKPWNPRDIPGVHRFLQRAWRLVVDQETGQLSSAVQDVEPDAATRRALHKTIAEVTEDIESMRFNTAIAHLIEFVNELTPKKIRPRFALKTFVLLLSPFSPHIAEELWQRLCGEAWKGSLAYETWPVHDPALAKEDEVEIAIQIRGKVKAKMMISADANEEAIEAAALGHEKIQAELTGKTVRRVIVVKGRLVNIVA